MLQNLLQLTPHFLSHNFFIACKFHVLFLLLKNNKLTLLCITSHGSFFRKELMHFLAICLRLILPLNLRLNTLDILFILRIEALHSKFHCFLYFLQLLKQLQLLLTYLLPKLLKGHYKVSSFL